MPTIAHDKDEYEEEPLDPATERIQARLRKMMMFSGLTLGLGIFAVCGAILYKVLAEPPQGSGEIAGGHLVLEAGMSVNSAVAANAEITLTVTAQDGRQYIRRHDAASGALIGQWELVFQASPSVPQSTN